MTTDQPIIRLQNTKSRRREEFEPLDPKRVGIYLCGPTVYDRAHLGNARPVLVFDVLYRLLRQTYGAEHVVYVRNFTDVDDKINARAAEAGREIGDITAETIRWYHDDMDALGALRPNHEPRATDFIGAMVDMINELILRGNAYEAEGHVLFAVDSYDAYGALSGRSLDDMIAGSRVEVAPYKRNPMDFVLWKPSGAGQPGWDSPWGVGRPGWHIECSAMSRALLGPAFDIHGGGNDLLFPHHENEIAQSCCADPEAGFATYWLHNEMLQVEGKKMSKSLGNFFTVRDLLDEGISGEVIRLVMLGTHYGKPMDWTAKKRDDADATLRRWYGILAGHGFGPALIKALKADGQWEPDAEFLGVLANDLNTPGAIARLHVLAKGKTPAQLAGFAHGLDLLGLVPDWADLPRLAGGEGGAQVDDAIAQRIDALLDTRAKARASKDWDMADRVRDILTAAGVVVTDVGGQASWAAGPNFDAAALVDL
ncbi:cysteinyl-tRNA synthetase [Loktanella salsilacus]|jgi:cysteinyl-tRNA synthetase|uniref:Cysteine--tRNA ligase n=1 Tax=Loktanella salsilacus TaxID=195913 RepID=A0A1I4CD22_9RHOB|nr:cysteine--tRNA ligase [Loktanella salsilacus]UTH49454.1 cysteine--tRNA ligase [Loktanella salsilacus]SFK78227.1 cysteinyl-tRNA synthetase [Loktanella salsilacus]